MIKILKSALVLGALMFVVAPIWAQDNKSNQGGDVAFGGAGTAPGKFLDLQDLTFDAKGTLYTLEGVQFNGKTKQIEANLRVQKFDRQGKSLGAIDLKSVPDIAWDGDAKARPGTGADGKARNREGAIAPARVAADSAGQVFVTVPLADKVLQFAPDGRFVRAIEIPGAMAIAAVRVNGEERIAVVPSQRVWTPATKWAWEDGDKILLLKTDGSLDKTVGLPQKLENVNDIAGDNAGNFYLRAEPNAIYKFSPAGQLLKTYGGNPATRAEDGSEVLHTVAVDSKGNVYTLAGDWLTRFDADGQNVTQRRGQWDNLDPWTEQQRYLPIAIDPQDRLWIGVVNRRYPDAGNYGSTRDVPAILRTSTDFFKVPSLEVRTAPVRSLGFKPDVKSDLPFNVAYQTGVPIPMRVVVAPGVRAIDKATAHWRVFDDAKNLMGEGTVPLALKNGEATEAPFSWTPTRFGGYSVITDFESPQGFLMAQGEHLAVTPRYAETMPYDLSTSKGGWEDPPRQMWTGLPNLRLHPAKGLDKMDADLKSAQANGTTIVVQLVDNAKNFKPEEVRAMMERFKGRIKYIEVCNEPNYSTNIEGYFKIHQQAYQIIKAIDPAVQVMGPATVNMNLEWLAKLYELGFKDVSDAVSIHDYEGHETIDPVHWDWKIAQMRAIMKKYGDENKPIWQTEHAISGQRGLNYQGRVQAIRMLLHRDLLETYGISSEHNNHYFLNDGGYIETYVWSAYGPQIAVPALRTRHALTSAMGRKYAGKLDFGPTGNTLYLGVRYAGADGETVSLRNLGMAPTAVEFSASVDALDVADAWGNQSRVPVTAGKAMLTLDQMPIYVRLPRGARFSPQPIDFGRDIAARARFTFSGPVEGDNALLNDGVIQTYQKDDPRGDTNGQKIWKGSMLDGPQTLEMNLGRAQAVNKVILRTPHADNQFCTLLDYDLQARVDGAWKTIETVKRPMPPSEPAISRQAENQIWMDDTNLFVHTFPTIQTDALRLVVRETTRGFVPDDRALAWGNRIPQKLMLREVEIYAPTTPVRVEGQSEDRTAIYQVVNASAQPFEGTLKIAAPAAWKADGPSQFAVKVAPNARQEFRVAFAPAATITAGRAIADATLQNSAGKAVDSSFAAFDTPSPIAIEILPSGGAAKGAVAQVRIKNTGATPVSGTAALKLSGPRDLTAEAQTFGPLAAGESVTQKWPLADWQPVGAVWNARAEVTANGVSDAAQRDFALHPYSIIGPFPRDFDQAFAPEAQAVAGAVNLDWTGQGVGGAALQWKKQDARADEMLDLGGSFGDVNDVLAYVFVAVDAPRAQKAILAVGADDGARVWLNGQVALNDPGPHGAKRGAQRATVELRAGRNEFLFKIPKNDPGWALYFDLLDPQTEKPLRDVTFSAR